MTVMNWRVVTAIFLASAGANAQWLNYTVPGTPLKGGKPNLSAPVPRAADGKPDLTGVWAHEVTPVSEFKRMFGSSYEAESKAALIGMELEVVHKYAMNIFADLKPGESLLSPAGEAAMKKRNDEREVTNVCHGEYGWPVAGLLAEPIKIVQAPKETVILYEVDHMNRQFFPTGAPSRPNSSFRRTSGTQSGIGMAIPSSSIRAGSTSGRRWMPSDIRAARTCT